MPLCTCSVRVEWARETIIISVRTAGVLPPRNVDKLLDVTNLLWLHKTPSYCGRVERKECTYHGAEQISVLRRSDTHVGILPMDTVAEAAV